MNLKHTYFRYLVATVVLAAAFVFPSKSKATSYPEVEPNETEAQATVVNNFTAGDSITGSGNAPNGDVDYFKLNLASQGAPGIYLDQLTFGPVNTGSGGEIHGIPSPFGFQYTPEQVILQSALGTGGVGSPTVDQFFTFGPATSLYYNVPSGASASQYTVTLSITPVAPQILPQTFQPGAITINTVGVAKTSTGIQQPTDLWVYDGNTFTAIPGYGNHNAPGSSGSTLTRNFAPGKYIVAISTDIANNQNAPPDDAYRAGYQTNAAGILVESGVGGSTGTNLSFTITDSSGNPVTVPESKSGSFDIKFVEFTVVPEPSTWMLLISGSAGMAFTAWRRRAQRR
jgi:hypothetical protein